MTQKNSESGNVLFYILIVVALFAALTQAMTSGGSESVTATSSMRIGENLKTQAQSIRSALTECVLTYTRGDYPATPGSGLMEDALCITDVTSSSTIPLFSGTAARYLPQPVAPFNAWTYVNDADGIRIQADTAAVSDYSVIDALNHLSQVFSSGEVFVVNDGNDAIVRFCITDTDNDCSTPAIP